MPSVQTHAPPEDSTRRLHAVEAYCTEMRLPEKAAAAARSSADRLGESSGGRERDELLRSLRLLAAVYGFVEPEVHGRRQARAAARECRFTSYLLAARLNSELSPAETDRLKRHLSSCLVCQASELRFARAERAFDRALHAPERAEAPVAASAEQRVEEPVVASAEQPAVTRLEPPAVASPEQPSLTSPARPAAQSSTAQPRSKRLGAASLAAGALVAAALVARRRRAMRAGWASPPTR